MGTRTLIFVIFLFGDLFLPYNCCSRKTEYGDKKFRTDEIESMSTRPVLSKPSQIQRDRNEVHSQSIGKPSIIRQNGSNLLQTSEKPPEWTLVEENKECDGSDVSKGRFLKVGGCSTACHGISTMFIYGTGKKCNRKGCKCWCETSARHDGTCSMNPIQNYELYKYADLVVDFASKVTTTKNSQTHLEETNDVDYIDSMIYLFDIDIKR